MSTGAGLPDRPLPEMFVGVVVRPCQLFNSEGFISS